MRLISNYPSAPDRPTFTICYDTTPKLHTCNCVQICTSKPSLKTGNSVSHHSLHVQSPSAVNFLVVQLPSSYVILIWHQPKPINFRMFQGTKVSLKITIKIHLHCSNIQKQNTDTLPKFNSSPPEKVTVPKPKRKVRSLPTIIFQGPTVKLRGGVKYGIYIEWSRSLKGEAFKPFHDPSFRKALSWGLWIHGKW